LECPGPGDPIKQKPAPESLTYGRESVIDTRHYAVVTA
jgi:hypothetical protein